MNGNSFHLYTLLSGESASSTDSWVEFRIVHVGVKDKGDGTGLTFQAVHMLKTAYKMNSKSTNAGGWASCALRAKMQTGGEIHNMFDSQLTSRVVDVSIGSKGILWIPSYSELTGSTQTYAAKDGEQFSFYKAKGTNYKSWLMISGTRSGGSVESIGASGSWWERTPWSTGKTHFLKVGADGDTTSSNYAINPYGVVPCLSL